MVSVAVVVLFYKSQNSLLVFCSPDLWSHSKMAQGAGHPRCEAFKGCTEITDVLRYESPQKWKNKAPTTNATGKLIKATSTVAPNETSADVCLCLNSGEIAMYMGAHLHFTPALIYLAKRK